MKVIVYNAKKYDIESLNKANQSSHHRFTFLESHLDQETVKLASGFECVSAFVNDKLDADILTRLSQYGIKLIALRCSGFNNTDIHTADQLGIKVLRVPEYSPHGVAEHALALILALNRKISKAHNRVRDQNFSLEGLIGFEIYGKTVGVIGTGKIGFLFAKLLKGFDARVIAFDKNQNPHCHDIGVEYVDLETLYAQSDIISLHVPLLPQTHHMIDEKAVQKMKKGVMLINISRGGLIDTQAVINGLKSGQVGYLGLDVYEEEGDIFFVNV